MSVDVDCRAYLAEQDEMRLIKEAQTNTMYGPLRGLQLKSYVSNIRNTLYTERLREKKEKYNDAINKYDQHYFSSSLMLIDTY